MGGVKLGKTKERNMPRIPLIPIESMEGQLKEAASMLKDSLGVVYFSP